ncbi:hypothetical protein ACFT2C_22955 [Promicromonospora sp. NPDC057138]|uniref:hypothetical protein n=1 Tax=Promicromonospora sp. NPDC057138 TaxID=3346031 RepID=UPI003640C25C
MSEPTTYAWAAAYAGLDDDALKALGNPGLLRRARKDTATAVSHGPQGAVLDVSGASVRVDGRGPAAVSCDCPTAGVCQHVLTACLWAMKLAPEAPAPGGLPSGAQLSGAQLSGAQLSGAPLAEAQLADAGGVVAQALPATSGAAPTRASRSASEALQKRRREALAEVRDVVGRLMSGGLSHLGPDDAESLSALAGRVRLAGFEQIAFDEVGGVRFDGLLRVAGGLVAGLAGRDDAVAESDLLDAFAEIWAMCEVLQRAMDTGRRADAAPGTIATAGAGGDRGAKGSRKGTGKATGDDEEVDLARWVPLGVRWWTSQSGSRGLAYLGWDAEAGAASEAGAFETGASETGAAGTAAAGTAASETAASETAASETAATGTAAAGTGTSETTAGRVRQVVTGRPSGTDPRFQRSWTSPLLWGRSLSGLCEGALALTGVRIRPDGMLGAGGNPVVRRLGAGSDGAGSDGAGFDLDELRAIAERTGAGVAPRDVVGFGRRPANVRLVLVRDVGEVGIDEVRQEMTLSVVTSDGETRMLRLPVAGEHAVETLLSVRSKLVAVTIERREDRDEPVGLFVRDSSPNKGGAIRLVSPTVTPAWSLESSHWDFWRRRIRKLKAQASSAKTVRPVAAPPSPVRRVTLLLGDVLLAAAATGRPALTARQRSDVEQARALARDLGLATLERTAGGLLVGDLTPPAVLHAAFVVGRARAVADVAG